MLASSPAKSAISNSNALSTVSAHFPESCAPLLKACQLTSFVPTDLSAAVDVYADWVDACDAVAKGGGEAGDYAPSRAPASRPSTGRPRDEDDDDAIVDDEEGMGGYGGREEGILADDEDY